MSSVYIICVIAIISCVSTLLGWNAFIQSIFNLHVLSLKLNTFSNTSFTVGFFNFYSWLANSLCIALCFVLCFSLPLWISNAVTSYNNSQVKLLQLIITITKIIIYKLINHKCLCRKYFLSHIHQTYGSYFLCKGCCFLRTTFQYSIDMDFGTWTQIPWHIIFKNKISILTVLAENAVQIEYTKLYSLFSNIFFKILLHSHHYLCIEYRAYILNFQGVYLGEIYKNRYYALVECIWIYQSISDF